MDRTPFRKVINPGLVLCGQTRASVFCQIDWDGTRLSMTGVIGPMRNGNAKGGCGQIESELSTIDQYTPGWDRALVTRFADLWRAWHLNDMRAGCEHQRAEGWDTRPIDPSKPLDAYGHHAGNHATWNMLTWVTRHEHPEGLLSEPCPTCGYKYGSAWLTEEVPDAVLDELRALPDTTVTPAWV